MNVELALSIASVRPGSRPGSARANRAQVLPRRRIHVLVADEKGMIRDAICALLGAMPEIAIVSSAATGADALRSLTRLRPDVVIVEFPKPPQAGPALIAAMKRQRPKIRVVVLTLHADLHLVEPALRAGADAYVLKKDSLEDLANALGSVLAGKPYLSPTVSGRVIRGTWRKSSPPDDGEGAASDLTNRERQVIRLIAYGHRTREIAQMLSVSHKTVEKHRANVMRKLGMRNAAAVAAYAMAHGFADD